jgi:FkbH-like protein
MYLGIVDRLPDPAAFKAYIETPKRMGAPANVIRNILQSDEFRQKTYDAAAPGLLKAAFLGILEREPDPTNLKARAALIRNDEDLAALLRHLVGGEEFNCKMRLNPDKLDENIIRLGYRFLYGRDETSPKIIKGHLLHASIDEFREVLINADEFKVRMQEPFGQFIKPPATPRLLGPPLEKLNILALGTCQIGSLLNVPGIGFKVKHMLFSTGRPQPGFPEVDLTGVDAVLVGLTLRACIGDMTLVRIVDEETTKGVIERATAIIDENLAGLHKILKGVPSFFMSFYEPSYHNLGNLMDRNDVTAPRYLVRKLNEYLCQALKDYSNFYFFDANEIINYVGRMHIQDDVVNDTGHASLIGDGDMHMDLTTNRLVPPRSSYELYNTKPFQTAYTNVFWNQLADNLKILRQIDPVKLIIVDLDHTMWRGIAAEDNLDQPIRTEGWPLGFAEALLFFKRRGGLLAICSKNDRQPTLERFRKFWGVRIQEHEFVSIKINWKSKPSNIAEILAETNLLPQNVVFIDDNPREIDEVKAAYPAMRCLGENHMDWRRIIIRSPETQVAVITAESAHRSQLVRARVEREAASQAMPREEWLKSLNIEQSFFLVRDGGSQYFNRSFELLNKTNQFNTTGRRWTLAEMQEFFEGGGVCVATSLKDKTIDNGIIGVALVKGGEIVQTVLSCRVFGLGAEVSMGRIATEIALTQAEKATGRIIDTGKNFTCHKYFEATQPCEAPDWIAISVDSMMQNA